MAFASALLTLTALGALTGCGAGQDAVTLQPYAAADGIQAQQGDVRVINALIVTSKEGTGALSLTIANMGTTGTVTLRGIDVAGKPATLSGASGDIAPSKVLRIGTDGPVRVALAAGGLKAGTYVPVVLHFAGALGDLAMQATAVPAESYYATVGPSVAPTAS